MRRGAVAVSGLVIMLAGGLAAQDQSPAGGNQQTVITDVANTAQTTAPDPVITPTEKESDGALPGDSHVRIVRLSQAQGKLVLDRGTGKLEATMQNMPIVQGSRLATSDGYAEVEFEDGSTLRLAPESQVDFPQLVLRSTGAKATTATLVKGTMYVSLEKTKDTEFTVKVRDAVMKVEPGTHMRLEDDGKKAVLAVFGGNVEMQAGTLAATVTKKKTATLDTTTPEEKIEVAKDIEEAPYDGWDKDALDYHNRYAKRSNFAASPYSYGISDLNYYGGFINAGGCGSMWRPYLVGSGWDPYGNGVWAWYQGTGYSWVSPYPWGWMPYHSGAWSFCPGVGWGWRPGGGWRGLANSSPIMTGRPGPGYPVSGTNRGGIALRPPGPRRPLDTPHSTLLLSNRTPLVRSKMDQPGNFVFEKNSAGLGVPRGTLGNLHGISNHVERSGFVNRQVYMAPIGPAREGIHPGTPMTFRPGSPNWNREGSPSGPNGQWRGNGQNAQAGNGNWNRGEHAGNAPAAAGQHGNNSGSGGSGFHGGGGDFHGGGSSGGGFHGGGGGGSMGSGGGGSMGGGGGGASHSSGGGSSSGGGGGHR